MAHAENRAPHSSLYPRRSEKSDCVLLALNGTEDHLHLVMQLAAKTSVSQLVKQAKGVSSLMANECLDLEERFRWQEGYGAFSVSRSHLNRVMEYVKNQKQRHADGKLWDEWEETDEAVEEGLDE